MQRARWGRTSQFALWAGLTGLALTIAILPPATGRAAQKKAEPEGLSAEVNTLQTEDGVNLRIKYYRSTAEKDAARRRAAAHTKDGNRFVWQPDNGLRKSRCNP